MYKRQAISRVVRVIDRICLAVERDGEHALDLYTYLKGQRPFEGFGRGAKAFAMGVMLKKIDRNYKSNPDIKWNFTKFVIDRAGNVVARFEPTADMKDVRDCIEGLL